MADSKHEAMRDARPRRMGMTLPVGSNPAAVRSRIEAQEKLLESSVAIPGIRYRVGLDAIAGLVPVVGDLLSAAMGAYLVWEARNIGMPKWKLWRMAGNLAVDTTLGSIPFAGDFFDVLFRSNTRNLRILKRHLDRHHPASQVIDA